MSEERLYRDSFTIKDAKILGGRFKNFSGRPTDYNRAGGKREFNIQLTPELREMLEREGGYNIKPSKQVDDDGEPRYYYVKVIVSYLKKAPSIKTICGGVENVIDEDTIGSLDDAEILRAKLRLQPSCYDRDEHLYTLYLDAARFTIALDDFDDDDEEEVPFN